MNIPQGQTFGEAGKLNMDADLKLQNDTHTHVGVTSKGNKVTPLKPGLG